MERILDRKPSYDERSRAFPIRTVVGAKAPRSYTWSVGKVLDQGSEGACVGFGWSHELLARPAIVAGVSDASALALYHEAKHLDEWEGDDYEGTSVLAGAKVVRAAGFMESYHWAFSLEEIVLAVGYRGPVVMGTNWWSSMWDTDINGWFPAGISGDKVGGHCWLAHSVHVGRKEFLCRNSWGVDWGFYGDFRLTYEQMGQLLHDDGEACLPDGRDKIGVLPT
jgi:hypothetical protein